MAGEAINIGKIYADLDINSGNMVRGLAQGERAVKLIEAELRNLDVQLKAGAIDMATYLSRVAQLDMAAGSLALKMKAANAAINVQSSALDVLNGKLAQTGQGMAGGMREANRFSMGLMQLGYIVDDLQYGFSAAINNIAPLVGGLTGNAGLAVAAQIAGVAAYQLYNNWDKVKAAFGDDTALNESRRSVEGLTKYIKELKAELESLPQGHTAVTLDIAKKDLKAKEKVEAEAESMEKEVDDQEKKERERHKQAIKEGGGIEKIAEKIGDRTFNEALTGRLGHISQFLSSDDYQEYAKRKKMADQGEVLGHTKEYIALNANLAKGLEEKARFKAREEARTFLARGALGKGDRELVKEEALAHPEDFGKETADALTGKGFTKKEIAESDKETAEYAKKDKELRKKQVKDFIERAVTDLKSVSDHLAAKRDRGEISEAARVEQLKDALWQGNLPQVISMKERDEAVQAEIDRTAEEDPSKRADRLQREASTKARKLVPDFQHQADLAVDRAHRHLISDDDAKTRLLDVLKRKGMGEDEAEMAVEAERPRLAKESPQRRSHRLKAEGLARAEEIVPDLADTVESAVAKGVMSGKGTGKFASDLDRMLGKAGMGDAQERQDAVKGLLERGQESVRERLANLASGEQGGKEQEQARSEVFATSQLNAKVQAGVGTDSEPKKQTSLLEKMHVALEKIAAKSVVQIEVQ